MIKTPEEIRRHVKATIKQDIYEGGKQEDIIGVIPTINSIQNIKNSNVKD
jgi:hypothetical protein